MWSVAWPQWTWESSFLHGLAGSIPGWSQRSQTSAVQCHKEGTFVALQVQPGRMHHLGLRQAPGKPKRKDSSTAWRVLNEDLRL